MNVRLHRLSHKTLYKIKEIDYNSDDNSEYCKIITDHLITSDPILPRQPSLLKNIEEFIFDPFNNRKLKIHFLPNDISRITPPQLAHLRIQKFGF